MIKMCYPSKQVTVVLFYKKYYSAEILYHKKKYLQYVLEMQNQTVKKTTVDLLNRWAIIKYRAF